MQRVDGRTGQTVTSGLAGTLAVLATAAIAGRYFRGEWGALLRRSAPLAALTGAAAGYATWQKLKPPAAPSPADAAAAAAAARATEIPPADTPLEKPDPVPTPEPEPEPPPEPPPPMPPLATRFGYLLPLKSTVTGTGSLTPQARRMPKPWPEDKEKKVGPFHGAFPQRIFTEEAALIIQGKDVDQFIADRQAFTGEFKPTHLVIQVETAFTGWAKLQPLAGELQIIFCIDAQPTRRNRWAEENCTFYGWRPGLADPFQGPDCFATFATLPTREASQAKYVDPFSAYLLLSSGSTTQHRHTHELDLSYNPLVNDDNVVDVVSRFKWLKKLHLRGCPNLTDAGVAKLACRLPNKLTELDLRDNLQLRQAPTVREEVSVLLDRTLVVADERAGFLERYWTWVTGKSGGDLTLRSGENTFKMPREKLPQVTEDTVDMDVPCAKETLEAFAQYLCTHSFHAGKLDWQELTQLFAVGKQFPQLQRLCADQLQMRLTPDNVAHLHGFAQENGLAALRQSCLMYASLFAPDAINAELDPYASEHSDIKIAGLEVQRRLLSSIFPYFRHLFEPYHEQGAYVQEEIEVVDGEALQAIAEQWGLEAQEVVDLHTSMPQAFRSLIEDARDGTATPTHLLNKLSLANIFGRPDLQQQYAIAYGRELSGQIDPVQTGSAQRVLQAAIASGEGELIRAVLGKIRDHRKAIGNNELREVLKASLKAGIEQDFILEIAMEAFQSAFAYEQDPTEIFRILTTANGLTLRLDQQLYAWLYGKTIPATWQQVPIELIVAWTNTQPLLNPTGAGA